jgi:hypothetical protein
LQPVRFIPVHHVPHGEAQRIEVALYTQQLQGVPPIAVDKLCLQIPQARDAIERVPGKRAHRRQRERKASHQPCRGIREALAHQDLAQGPPAIPSGVLPEE